MADLIFVGQFIASRVGKTGLTVTVDVDRYTLSDGTRTALVTGGSATEGRRGLYHYRLADADLATYQYVATFITADATVDQKEIAALGIVIPDVMVSSRLASASYTTPLDATATQAAAAAALNAYDPPSNAEMEARTLAAAGYATAANLATLAGYVDTEVAAIKAVTDQLDVSAVTQVASSSAGHLTITAGLTFSEGVTGLTIPADWVSAIWTLKFAEQQVDTAARIQLRVSNPADGEDGLQRINGAAPETPLSAADGALTVTQASGRIDIYLTDELTALLERASGLGWDVKFIDADGDSTGRRGTADVVLTETRALA